MTRIPRFLFTRTNRAANLTIVLLLSFGLGAAALLSAALDRFLLHPLDVPYAETLVSVMERHPPVTNTDWFPYSLYDAMRTMHALREVAAESDIDTSVSLRNGAQADVRPILAQMVSGNYFSILGTATAAGRTLGPADERPTTAEIPVVLGYRFWTRAFARSRSILGSTLTIGGKPFVIVGIMPQSFFGTRIDQSPDVWLPLSAQPLLSHKSLTDPDSDRHCSSPPTLAHIISRSTASPHSSSVSAWRNPSRRANVVSVIGTRDPCAPVSLGSSRIWTAR
ncbi:MAG: ABC transporter permease [Acidobacteriaceae bacterium]